MHRRFIPAVLLVLVAPACGFDAQVTADGGPLPVITCHSDEDCPPDWLCRIKAEQCIPRDQLDTDAPALVGTPILSPRVGAIGQIFTLTLEVTEALDADPIVLIETGGGRTAEWTVDESTTDREGLVYAFGYPVTGSEQEGTRLVTLSLVDEALNEVEDLAAGTLALDFTAPRVQVATMAPTVAMAGVEVTLSLETSETLPAAPIVTLVNGDGSSLSLAQVGASESPYLYAFTPDGSESQGLWTASATGADAVGNSMIEADLATVLLDFDAPSVVGTTVFPPVAAAGQRVLVEVEFSEEVPGWEALGAQPTAPGPAEHDYTDLVGSSRLLRFQHNVAPGGDGVFILRLRGATDVAGNTAPLLDVGTVTYDTTAPGLLTFEQSHPAPLVANAADTVVVRFTADELLGLEPEVTLGALNMTRQGAGTDPYEYTLVLAGTGLIGSVAVQVRIEDEVGNGALLTPGGTEVDAVPPELVDVVFTPPVARLGITAALTVSASEYVVPPALVWSAPGDPGYGYQGPTGLAHLWTLPVTPGATAGLYEISGVTLTDLAGNQVTVSTQSLFGVFEVDNLPPVLTNLVTDATVYSAQPGYRDMVLSFDAYDGALEPLTTLEVGMGTATFLCGAFQPTSPNYTCTYTVLGSGVEQEGASAVSVRAVDAAGNESNASTAVQLDFTAPDVVPGTTELRLSPAADCPLSDLTSWSDGTTARVSFLLTEPVVTQPSLGTSLPEIIPFAYASGTATFFSYEKTLAGEATVQGLHELEVLVEDAVGNTNAITLTPSLPLVVDTLPPAAPAVDSPGLVRYLRIPWGQDAARDGTFVAKSFRIESLAGAVDADTTEAIAYEGPDPATAAQIGRAPAAGGSFGTMVLNRVERPEIYLGAFDAACNASPTTRVRDVSLVTTMGNKVAGSTYENPHTITANRRFAGTLEQNHFTAGEVGDADLARVVTVDQVGIERTGCLDWIERVDSDPGPPNISGTAAIYDSLRGKVMLYGGRPPSGPWDPAWEWDIASGQWTELDLLTQPRGRYYHVMAFDPITAEAVLFGGYGGGYLSDTWIWNGARGTWTEVFPGQSPPATYSATMVQDTMRGKALLFGGYAQGGQRVHNLWEWDGPSRTWTDLTALSPTFPEDRILAGMAFDPIRGKVVLFGGQAAMGFARDTWEWDISTKTWTMISDMDPASPVARYGHSMIYDVARGLVILRGGTGDSGSVLQDTWAYDGATSTWTQLTQTHPQPYGIGTSKMVYDSARDVPVLFGQRTASDEVVWEWQWSGASAGSWKDHSPATPKPAPRDGHYMAYVGSRDRVVLFGGLNDAWVSYQDTWEWNPLSGAWADRTRPVRPPARERHRIAWDESQDEVVLFGGRNGSVLPAATWIWSPATKNWTQVFPSVMPPARMDHGMVYDRNRQKVVIFGGYSAAATRLQDTWEWDGATRTWSERLPTGPIPSGRNGHAMTYDSGRGKVIIASGNDGSGGFVTDTWEWDGDLGTWTQRVSVPPPPSRGSLRMVYDEARGKVFSYNTDTMAGPIPHYWSWDPISGNWTPEEAVGFEPLNRLYPELVYDSNRHRTILFGGYSSDRLNDLWEVRSGGVDRPSTTWTIDLRVLGIDPGAALGSIRWTAFAGAVGYRGAATVSGIELRLWDQGRWWPMATNADDPTAPGWIEANSASPLLLGRTSLDRPMFLTLLPSAPGGTGSSSLTVDYLEMQLDYRLP